jgi:hypothetical protein
MMSPKLSYQIGDPVWISVCCQGKVRGVVIAEFQTADDPITKYVIRVDDPDFPHEEVRDALLMSPVETAPPPYLNIVRSTEPETDPRQ